MERRSNEDEWMEMKRAGMRDTRGTAYCMETTPNGKHERTWKK